MRKNKVLAGRGQVVTGLPFGQGRPERRLATEGLRSFFASHSVGYFCLDENGLVTMANLTLLGWLGLGYASVIGKLHFRDLLAGPCRPAFDLAFQSLREQGQLRDFRGELDGGQPSMPVQVHLTAIQSEEGHFLRFDGVVLDDSERLKAETTLFADGAPGLPSLQEHHAGGNGASSVERAQRLVAETRRHTSEERFQAVVAALGEGVILQRQDGVILSWNPSAERILGMSAEEVIGAAVLDGRWRAVRADHTPFPEALCPFRPTGRLAQACRDVVMGLRRPDGSHRWISLNTAPLFRPGEAEPYGVVASFSDITASRKAAQLLAFTQYAVDHASEGVARVGEDGRFRYVNDAACRLLGYTREEMMALTVPQVDANLSAAAWPGHWQHLLEQGSSIQETILRARDGREIPVELSISVLAPFGRTFHFTTLRDLTEQKRGEAALAESESRYRSVVTTIREGIVVQNGEGMFVTCNPSAELILGIAREALVGTHCSQLQALRENGAEYPEEERPSQVALRTGQPCTEESMGVRRPDGREVWVSVHSVPLIHPGEIKAHAIVSSFADVTEKRRVEKNLRFTQFAVDHAAEGIVWIREDGSFTYANDEACRMLGYTRAEMLSRKVYDIDALLTESSWPVHWQQLAPGGTYILDTLHRAKDGQHLPVELAISVEAMDGRPFHCVFIRDLTERMRAEGALRESEARVRDSARRVAAVEEQERRHLAAELHDSVGSSLGALAIYLKDITDRLPVATPDQLAPVLEDARAVLTDAVAAMRAITSELRPTLLDYAGLPEALADYARQFQARSGICVRMHSEGGTPWRATQEEDIALFRITQEALHNCAKHARAGTVTLELHASPRLTALTIVDDGIGFNPVCPVDDRRPWGLGLLSMRERAVAIGWQFELESAEGRGTRIRVSRGT